MLESLLREPATWLTGSGPESDVAISSKAVLRRNLADYPFPGRCSADERKVIEEWILSVLDRTGLRAQGQYWPVENLTPREVQLLVERFLITEDFVKVRGHRGIFISRDQSLCVTINGIDHLTIQVTSPGLQLQGILHRLSGLDDQIGACVDYAFNDRFGYLTSGLNTLGTGLQFSVAMHLPGLSLSNRLHQIAETVSASWHDLEGVNGKDTGSSFDLYRLRNKATLGRSEEEIVFYLRHDAAQIVEQERRAREAILKEGPCILEDRVGRALGIARGARLLSEDEAAALLSSLRLGVATGFLKGYTFGQLNELFVESQHAHLEVSQGHDCDDLTLNMQRAELFRARFS